MVIRPNDGGKMIKNFKTQFINMQIKNEAFDYEVLKKNLKIDIQQR